MNSFQALIIFLAMVVLASSCRNDFDEVVQTETETQNPEVFVNTSFNVFVFDEAGEPLEDVRITMNSKSVLTDSRGFFHVSGFANSKGAYLKAGLIGYFEAFANVVPSPDRVGHIRFVLKPRVLNKKFDSNSDAAIILNNGTEVFFHANSFVDDLDNPYEGEVRVFTDYVDPSSDAFAMNIPGDLSASSTDGQAVILQSFGMLNVELESESGKPLQVNQNTPIKVKVPEGRLGQAPNEIAFWYFDTDDGLWKEEGSAVLIDGYYEGEVNHFTLWDCGVSFPRVTLSGQICSRYAIPFTAVKITWIESGEMKTTYTDSEGYFSGEVPSNTELLVEIIDACGQVVYSQQLGPLVEDEFLKINLSPAQYDYFVVSGKLFCEEDLVTNGYVLIELENANGFHFATVDQQGCFSTEILNCNSNSFIITGVDIDANMQGAAEMFAIETEVNIEGLQACEEEIEYKAVFSFNNEEHTIWNTELYLESESILINTYDTIDGYASQVQYAFLRSAEHDNNWVMGMGHPLYGDNHIVYNARLPNELQGSPGHVNYIETADYIEFYLPIASIRKYSLFASTGSTYEGSFLIRAEK